MMGVGAIPPPFDILILSGGNMYTHQITEDENDVIYEALNEYVMRHKKYVQKLQNVDRDDLNDDDFILMCNYHTAVELREKFEAPHR
jgi:hypothetical protein